MCSPLLFGGRSRSCRVPGQAHLQALQNGQRLLRGGLVHNHRLEAPAAHGSH